MLNAFSYNFKISTTIERFENLYHLFICSLALNQNPCLQSFKEQSLGFSFSISLTDAVISMISLLLLSLYFLPLASVALDIKNRTGNLSLQKSLV